MTVAIIVLGVLTLTDLVYLGNAWVKPRVARRFRFEPGRDDEVSWKEMWRRSARRYDSRANRIMSILGFVLLVALWWFVISGV